MDCPHCGAVATTRSSRAVSNLSRIRFYRCSNQDCGFRFQVVLSIVSTIKPSKQPKAGLYIADQQQKRAIHQQRLLIDNFLQSFANCKDKKKALTKLINKLELTAAVKSKYNSRREVVQQ